MYLIIEAMKLFNDMSPGNFWKNLVKVLVGDVSSPVEYFDQPHYSW